ncbi:MAG: hypothetical protein AAGA30_17400, partial [Planctomycetota bacterium]
LEAIWTALLYDFKLDYVSPPPAYNVGTQRLRTPSQVLSERRGTCVDLALLAASCFEWIELYPVIFNTSKHAFVGCWRYDEPKAEPIRNAETEELILSHSEFFEKFKAGHFTKEQSVVSEYPWVLGEDDFGTLCDLVYNGAIIPLETVCLTEYRLYSVAREYAIGYFIDDRGENLDRAKEMQSSKLDEFYPGPFESLTDVISSRQCLPKSLQPLPLSQI